VTELRGYAKGRERREEILAAADAAFAKHGFRGTSLATIAQEVGLSQPGLLHHFPSKEHLLLEVLRYRDEQGLEYVTGQLDDAGGYADALLELCAANTRTPGLVRLFSVLAAESVDDDHPAHQFFRDDHPAHQFFRERYRHLRERAATRFAEEQREGRLAAGVDPETLAVQVLALFDGLQLQWLLEPDAVDMVEVMRDFLARLD
jgi:AcrR family transcriptional regulator